MTKDKIIQKQKELIDFLIKALGHPTQPRKLCDDWRTDFVERITELTALESQDEVSYANTCCICHENYVDSSSGFDTCQSCLTNI